MQDDVYNTTSFLVPDDGNNEWYFVDHDELNAAEESFNNLIIIDLNFVHLDTRSCTYQSNIRGGELKLLIS